MKFRWYALIIVLLMFVFTYSLFFLYHNHYNIPFGKYDVDNYMCFIGENVKNYDEPCLKEIYRYSDDRIHFGLIQIIRVIEYHIGDFSLSYTYFVSFFLCLFIPLGYWHIGCKYYRDRDTAAHYVLFMIFGTFTYFLFGVLSVWSQMLGYLFYLLFLGEYFGTRHTVMYYFLVLSIFFHPYILMVYVLYLLAYIIEQKQYNYLIGVGLLGIIVYSYLGLDLLTYTYYSNELQPPLYQVIFIHMNPILFYISILAVIQNKKHRTLYLLMSLLIFSHYSRGLVYFFPIMMIKVVDYVHKNKIHLIMLYLFMFLHFFGGMWWTFVKSFLFEMKYGRLMDTTYIENLLGYKEHFR